MVSRRNLFSTLGGATVISLSGCLGMFDNGEDGGNGEDEGEPEESELSEEDYPAGLSDGNLDADEFFNSTPVMVGGVSNLKYKRMERNSENVNNTVGLDFDEEVRYSERTVDGTRSETYTEFDVGDQYTRVESESEEGEADKRLTELGEEFFIDPLVHANYIEHKVLMSSMDVSDHWVEEDNETDGRLLVYEAEEPDDDQYLTLEGTVKIHEDGFIRFSEYVYTESGEEEETYTSTSYIGIDSTTVEKPD